MTRKDFILIAAILRDSKPTKPRLTTWWNMKFYLWQYKTWVKIVNAFAKQLKANNPKFKKDVFLKAAGVLG